MRYLLILALALGLTIVWQTSVVADNPAETTVRCASGLESPVRQNDPDFRQRTDCN
jgi:hypothetical protein